MSCCQAARIARSGRPCRQRRGAPLADLPNFPLALLTSHVALQVWELYNSVQQTQARTHPGILGTQKALLGLFHTSSAESPVSVRTPISYYDRLRIRFPGDSVFALGEHIDGGSLERWEDPGESFGDAVSVMTLDWTADESCNVDGGAVHEPYRLPLVLERDLRGWSGPARAPRPVRPDAAVGGQDEPLPIFRAVQRLPHVPGCAPMPHALPRSLHKRVTS